ncbi:DUF3592 domain-containing protein [Flavobacterium plurextorum]|uniref:DUF3592 domain-containing protein n=1 Tax=Flavobacterium plurextorum TaxID=1114867 RepID=UPI0037569A95
MFIIPFLLIGLGTLSFSSYNIFKALQAKGWTPVSANIEKTDITSHSNKGTVSHEVIVRYLYVIEGKKYSGKRIAFGYGMNNIDDHDGLYSKLENSKKVLVYVNPSNNEESVIVPGMNDSITGLLIFTILWNSFIVVLGILPFVIKGVDENNEPRFTAKEATWIIFIIWIAGFAILFSNCFHIDIESKINVLESRNVDLDIE